MKMIRLAKIWTYHLNNQMSTHNTFFSSLLETRILQQASKQAVTIKYKMTRLHIFTYANIYSIYTVYTKTLPMLPVKINILEEQLSNYKLQNKILNTVMPMICHSQAHSLSINNFFKLLLEIHFDILHFYLCLFAEIRYETWHGFKLQLLSHYMLNLLMYSNFIPLLFPIQDIPTYTLQHQQQIKLQLALLLLDSSLAMSRISDMDPP